MSPSKGQQHATPRLGPYMIAAAINGLQHVAKCPPEEWRALLAAVGLTPEETDQDGGLVPLHKGFAAFEAVAAWARNPTLAIDYAKAFAVGGTGPLGFALINARTIRDALGTLSRYLPIVVSLRYCRYEEDAISGRIVWQHPGNESPPRLQCATWSVAVVLERLAPALPPGWKAPAIVLDVEPPRDPGPFEAYFGPGLRFARGPNWAAVETGLLDRPMPAADPRLFELMTRLAEIEQRQRGAAGSDFESEARAALHRLLRQGEATAADLAGVLAVTPAQLRAKLKQYGFDFRTLIDDVRRETARRYLGESDLSITAIAFDLGYADSSMFTRACHKWFGKSPRDLRNEVLAASRGTVGPARAKPPTLD